MLIEGLVALALMLEVAGIIAIAAGIVAEVKRKAGWGFMAVTIGSLLIAIGALIWAKVIPTVL